MSVVFPGFVRDAGMVADAKVELPPGVGTSSPDEVAVASSLRSSETAARSTSRRCPCKLVSVVAGFAPEFAAGITRRMGADKVSAKVADGQRDKR